MGDDISQGSWFPVPGFHVGYQMKASLSQPLSTKTSNEAADAVLSEE